MSEMTLDEAFRVMAKLCDYSFNKAYKANVAWKVIKDELTRLDSQPAEQPKTFDRTIETPRRKQAVEKLLVLGWTYHHENGWVAPLQLAALPAQCQVRKDGQGVASCDWPAGNSFTVLDDPDEHKPCYLVMPDGAALPLYHHATNGVDQARAKFIADACNAALASPSAGAVVPEALLADLRKFHEETEACDEFDLTSEATAALLSANLIEGTHFVLTAKGEALLAAAPEVDTNLPKDGGE